MNTNEAAPGATMKTTKQASMRHWFYFYCERCGDDSDTHGFLLNGDWSDCFHCDQCFQLESDKVKTTMTFRSATRREILRLDRREYDIEKDWAFPVCVKPEVPI
jgi:hypothetical protein